MTEEAVCKSRILPKGTLFSIIFGNPRISCSLLIRTIPNHISHNHIHSTGPGHTLNDFASYLNLHVLLLYLWKINFMLKSSIFMDYKKWHANICICAVPFNFKYCELKCTKINSFKLLILFICILMLRIVYCEYCVIE